MSVTRHAFIYGLLLLVSLSGNGQNETKPRRTVKGLPRYMTDIPQPIPPQIKLPDAPKTARDVKCFASFTKATSMNDVVRKCGVPDEHQGSGIYIFLYDMNDGSVVVIGTADLNHLIYLYHVTNRGSRSLMREAPDAAGTRSEKPRAAGPSYRLLSAKDAAFLLAAFFPQRFFFRAAPAAARAPSGKKPFQVSGFKFQVAGPQRLKPESSCAAL